MTDWSGLSLAVSASLPAGWATAFSARWLDRRLDILLDHGWLAAIGASVDGDRPSPGNPSLEIAATLLMGVVAAAAESAVQRAAGMTLSAALFLCAWIDWRAHILPDVVVLPLLAAGLVSAASCRPFVDAGSACCGALLGWGMACLVRLAGRNLQGCMGAGDIKLLAAIGAWLGPVGVTMVFLLSSIFMTIYLIIFGKWKNDIGFSFGPALSVSSIFIIVLIFIFPGAGPLLFFDATANFAMADTHRGTLRIGLADVRVLYL